MSEEGVLGDRKCAIAGAGDDCRTIPEDKLADVVAEAGGHVAECVDVAHDRGFALAFTRGGAALDVDRLAALLDGLDGLLRAGLTAHARSVFQEARNAVEAVRGPRAEIVDLAALRRD